MKHQYKSKELKQEVMKPLPLWANWSCIYMEYTSGSERGEGGELLILPLPSVSDWGCTWRN